jgi:hypothetical protein
MNHVQDESVKKYCNFCGEPMLPDAKECKQCGWDSALDAPPETDPGDRKARLGVAAGLVVAYVALWSLVQAAPAEDLLPARRAQTVALTEPLEPAERSPVDPAIDMGRMSAVTATGPEVAAPPSKLISIKVADVKSSTVPPREALQYEFQLPETDQKCKLVGSTKGVNGFGRNIEVFLLTDDEYVFWHANPVAIAQSSWETFRGSEATLNYDLPGAGAYHFIVSNVMSATPQVMAVKAQVKCVR